MAQWGGSANPYRFAGAWGYREDGDAGLLHVGARYYEPAVGRWTSADKWLGNLYQPLSLNRYLYCEDDPVNAVDPSGYAKLREIINALLAAITMIYPGPSLPEEGSRPGLPPPRPPAATAPPPSGWPPLPPPGVRPPNRSGGAGGVGAVIAIIVGAEALAEGLRAVVPYVKKVQSYEDPEGEWIP